jgi:hypothetical protein
MITDNKLLPKAYSIANNIKGIKLNTSSSYRLPSRKTSKWQNPVIDAVNFMASVYAKEVKIANFNADWDKRLVNGEPQTDQYVVVQSNHYKTVGTIVAFSELEWDQLQVTISKLFNIIYPFEQLETLQTSGYYTAADINNMFSQMGVFSGGTTPSKALLDADGNLIGTFDQGLVYANRWNTLKVPADAALGVITPYLAPIYQPAGETIFYYRYTGIRQWQTPFEGYDLY